MISGNKGNEMESPLIKGQLVQPQYETSIRNDKRALKIIQDDSVFLIAIQHS